MFVACLIAFLSAAGTDIVMAKWVKSVSLDQSGKASVLSMMMAMLLLQGINRALYNGAAAYAWVFGYGVGSFIVVEWNKYVKAKTA